MLQDDISTYTYIQNLLQSSQKMVAIQDQHVLKVSLCIASRILASNRWHFCQIMV